MRVVAPMSGVVLDLRDVPDAVFSTEMVGPGLAIDPGPGDSVEVRAPVGGRIAVAFPHAVAIEMVDGRTVLVHLGIDTVELAGEGFETHVVTGQPVAAGEPLLTWSPALVLASGRSAISPVVALQTDPGVLTPLVTVGQPVVLGAPLFDWT